MGAETVAKQVDRLRSQLVRTHSQLQNPFNEQEREIILRRMDSLLDRYNELRRSAPNGVNVTLMM